MSEIDSSRSFFARSGQTLRLATLVALLVVPFSCRQHETPVPTDTSPPVIAAEAAQPGGTLVRRLSSDINSLNMVLMTTEAEKQVVSYIVDPLVDLDANLEVIPALAESWDISPDGRVYTFHLNHKATFSDGSPVQAADVLFTLRTIADPANESAQFSGLFQGMVAAETKAIDPYTVQVAFATPRASQLLAFNIGILPEHFYGKGNFTNDFNDTIMGSGPYVLRTFVRGKEIVLERRPDYWRKAPYLQRVIFRVIPNDAVAWNAMKVDDIDELQLTSDQWKFERDNPEVQRVMDIRRFYGLNYNFVPWNEKNPLLADKRIRRALSLCLDRTAIINNVYYGTARIITGPFTPDQWAYNSDVPAVPYDPAQARRIFASVGWTDTDHDGVLDRNGKPFAIEMLLSSGNAASRLQSQIFQDSLRAVGVRLNLVPVDFVTLSARVMSGKYDSALLAWNLDLDPDTYAYFHSSQFPPHGQNVVYYSNPEADRLMEAARVEFDLAKRKELYHQLHALLAEDQPYTWTVQVSIKWAVNRRIQNVELAGGLGPFEWFPGPYEWWIPQRLRKHENSERTAR